VGDKASEISFSRTSQSLFQQRWISKAVVRAYHGDFINEKVFKRWYLPSTLPDVRPRRKIIGDDTVALNVFAKRKEQAQKESRKREEDVKGLPPVGSLMFTEVERRIDVFIFRCCFAHSVYEARRLVIHGDVLLNGKKVRPLFDYTTR
jgi:ribosomal protein S4